ncbi:MAG: helix-turn-helix transcriptional regulator [Actinobacteria bacterium]|nr:MAG: helix-turn-helix transcriptional regulator [Actinomycetota bacterium]
MDLRDLIADLLEREGIGQKVLAERAGVHQATVSRALKRQPSRRTAAYARLCSYMQQYAASRPAPTDPVLDAVRETWDGSEEHARALAKLILASRELWPTLGKETAP